MGHTRHICVKSTSLLCAGIPDSGNMDDKLDMFVSLPRRGIIGFFPSYGTQCSTDRKTP